MKTTWQGQLHAFLNVHRGHGRESELEPPTPVFWMTALHLLSLGEPISSEHFHRAVNVNDEDLLLRILEGG